MAMTAELDWEVDGLSETDADLARASAAGDKRAFAAIYDRYADKLHDFCVGMLADRDAAADCVQDAFCIAATRLPQLRDPDKLRPWMYSIARNEALRRLRERRRETPSDELPEIMSDDPGPDTMAARMELTDLIADAAGGLSDRDRSVLELAFRHGLGGPDLADALNVSPASANQIVHRLRETIERSLGALLMSRRSQSIGGCAELAGILESWDGNFNVLMRKRISRHIASCDVCDEERRRLVNPVALLGAAPVFIPAPAWLRDRTLGEVQLTSASGPLTDDRSQADDHRRADGTDAQNTNGYLIPVAVFVIALIASMTAAFIWLGQKTDPIAPTEVSTTAPAPALPPPPSLPPPPPPASVTTAPSTPPATPRTRSREAPLPPPPSPPVATTPVAEPTSTMPPPPGEPPVPPPPPPPPPWPDWMPDWSPLPPPPPGGGTPPLIIDPVIPPAGSTALP
jgi:RNA polymerase sigma factor (sigma-70 family)